MCFVPFKFDTYLDTKCACYDMALESLDRIEFQRLFVSNCTFPICEQ